MAASKKQTKKKHSLGVNKEIEIYGKGDSLRIKLFDIKITTAKMMYTIRLGILSR